MKPLLKEVTNDFIGFLRMLVDGMRQVFLMIGYGCLVVFFAILLYLGPGLGVELLGIAIALGLSFAIISHFVEVSSYEKKQVVTKEVVSE